jgi:hypothetical protein
LSLPDEPRFHQDFGIGDLHRALRLFAPRKTKLDQEIYARRLLRLKQKYDNIGKSEFETILRKIMEQVENNYESKPDEIATLTPKVLAHMPNKYGQLSEKDRSMEAMIAYLDGKYQKELGILE